MVFVVVFSVIIIIFIIYIFFENKNRDVSFVVSNVDNKKYLVQNFKDKQDAANLLANCRNKLKTLCIKMKETYPDRDDVLRMNKKFNPDAIVETASNSKHTSYSINKGEKMVLCLRSRDGKNKLVEENVLMFVALHELAHVMTKSVGHTTEFWDNFKFILREAVKNNVYTHVDFNNSPKEYCGVTITDSPLSR